MFRRSSFVRLSLVVVSLFLVSSARADVTLPSIFSSSMVLQQELPVPVWGWADPGEKVEVSFGGQSKTAEADKSGRWQLKLDALMANAKGQTLTVTGNNKIELADVPSMARGMGLVLIIAGSLSMAFMGFAGLFSS